MKRIATAVALFALLAGSAYAEDGKALFGSKCAACHGADGKGSKMGEKLGVKDLNAVKGSAADIQKTIETGKPPKMTAYKGKLSDAEIKAIADYVKATFVK